MDVKNLSTLGPARRQTQFQYSGSIRTGVVLHQSGNPRVEAGLFAEALRHFAGKDVYGGFSEDNPTLDGFGEWLRDTSARLNKRKLSPRHGSLVAAILCAEASVRSSLKGNAVVLHFPEVGKKLLPPA